ncbi:glutaredoxin family protein [Quatrionicoccus australiensis]|uniref:glutaredoxin family protein n=1 Tax=Quatrionicoccus australiensis TaxID=138118 RepID=UPI001CF8A2D8|nr:glutaredoxin family protein [Quatrionicoccus australiensis]UCV15677.1 glutaredoxin family protein [Quatrionicoccus australiensis]
MLPICPHCGHARTANAEVPDWQCPACGKAYAKVDAHLSPAERRQYGRIEVPENRGGGSKWLLLLLVFGALLWFTRPLWQARVKPPEPVVAIGQPAVHLYATDWCGYCKASREFFHTNGIRYTEHDIEKSTEALNTHRKLGGNGVPLIVVGDEVVNGYNEDHLRQLLRPWIRG